MRSSMVSIVMPVYNAVATVEAAVRSLLAQTHEHLEIVVVDDGSTDGSPDVVAGLGDARITLVRQRHRGLVTSLNCGCALAQGEYIARLDADDLAHPTRIAAQVEYLAEHPDIGLLGTWAAIAGDQGTEGTFEPPTSDPELRRYLLWDNPFIHSSVMLRADAFRATGGYPEGLAEEYRLWIRIARTWKLAVLPQVLVTYHVHRASYTRGQRRTTALRGRLRAQWEAAWGLGPWYLGILALGGTCGTYLLARLGGAVEETARRSLEGASRRSRGFRRVPGVRDGGRPGTWVL